MHYQYVSMLQCSTELVCLYAFEGIAEMYRPTPKPHMDWSLTSHVALYKAARSAIAAIDLLNNSASNPAADITINQSIVFKSDKSAHIIKNKKNVHKITNVGLFFMCAYTILTVGCTVGQNHKLQINISIKPSNNDIMGTYT